MGKQEEKYPKRGKGEPKVWGVQAQKIPPTWAGKKRPLK